MYSELQGLLLFHEHAKHKKHKDVSSSPKISMSVSMRSRDSEFRHKSRNSFLPYISLHFSIKNVLEIVTLRLISSSHVKNI